MITSQSDHLIQNLPPSSECLQLNWLQVLKSCPVSMDNVSPRSRALPKETLWVSIAPDDHQYRLRSC